MHPLALFGGKPTLTTEQHTRWPILTSEDQQRVQAVLERGILSGPFAPEVRGLEEEFSAYLGSRYCLATNSGTAALHIALAALGVGPGDEVIVPAFTFIATAMAVLHQNAIPVFVDIEPQTLGMDPKAVQKAITPRTRAIIPVHMHGIACDFKAIAAVAGSIPIVEDSCQAHGATYYGQKTGTLGSIGTFSLQSSKSLACGEGGLFVTENEEYFHNACRTRMFGENIRPADAQGYQLNHALDATRAYDSVTMGWMYRTNEMSAALARSQLKRLDLSNQRAQRNAAILTHTLNKLPGVTPPFVPKDCTSNFHKYRVRFQTSLSQPHKVRDALVEALKAEGVEAVLWQTRAVPAQTLFQEKMGYGKGFPWNASPFVDYRVEQFPETTRLLESSFCLFSQSYPLGAQSEEVCQLTAQAFVKVWNHLDEIIDRLRLEKIFLTKMQPKQRFNPRPKKTSFLKSVQIQSWIASLACP